MELALLVYGISLLPQINVSINLLMAALMIVIVIASIAWVVNSDERHMSENEKERSRMVVNSSKTWVKRSITWIFIAGVISTLLPSEKTAYMMVGGYVSQRIVQSDTMGKVVNESSKISGKILNIINNKLDGYVEETMENAKTAITNGNKS